MAHDTGPAMGMSVGATTLCAVTADRAITRRPVLTLFRDRPSRIGVPSDAPGAAGSDDRGLVVTDFVDRVGETEPVTASDGSTHRAEQLLADALHALAYAVTEGGPLPPAVAVTHPAHWPKGAVDALRTALGRVSEWSQHPVSLTSDTVAVLAALQANPGLPDHGVIAVCDFGGSGSSITLVDAAAGFQQIGATRRHTAFSGAAIDQALLDHVVADLGANGTQDTPPTVGSLSRLRNQCRDAKEQLSAETVAELAGFHGGVWLTRVELDEAIRELLAGFYAAVRSVLAENATPPAGLSAIVSVGGGANLPVLTTGLSQQFGVPVISAPRPQLTAAIGAALGVAGNLAEPAKKAPKPEPSGTPVAAEPFSEPFSGPGSGPLPEPVFEPVPWGEVTPPGAPAASSHPMDEPPALLAEPSPGMSEPAAQPEPASPRRPPATEAAAEPEAASRTAGGPPWYRRPVPVIVGAALIALLMGTVAVLVLRHAADGGSDSGILTSVSTTATTEAATTETPTETSPVEPSPTPEPAPQLGPTAPEESAENPGAPIGPPAPEATQEQVAP